MDSRRLLPLFPELTNSLLVTPLTQRSFDDSAVPQPAQE